MHIGETKVARKWSDLLHAFSDCMVDKDDVPQSSHPDQTVSEPCGDSCYERLLNRLASAGLNRGVSLNANQVPPPVIRRCLSGVSDIRLVMACGRIVSRVMAARTEKNMLLALDKPNRLKC